MTVETCLNVKAPLVPIIAEPIWSNETVSGSTTKKNSGLPSISSSKPPTTEKIPLPCAQFYDQMAHTSPSVDP